MTDIALLGRYFTTTLLFATFLEAYRCAWLGRKVVETAEQYSVKATKSGHGPDLDTVYFARFEQSACLLQTFCVYLVIFIVLMYK